MRREFFKMLQSLQHFFLENVMKISRARLKLIISESLRYFGLPENATEAQLKLAYRQKAKELHPDKKGGDTEEFQKLEGMRDAAEKEIRDRKSLSRFRIPTIMRQSEFDSEEDSDSDFYDDPMNGPELISDVPCQTAMERIGQ